MFTFKSFENWQTLKQKIRKLTFQNRNYTNPVRRYLNACFFFLCIGSTISYYRTAEIELKSGIGF